MLPSHSYLERFAAAIASANPEVLLDRRDKKLVLCVFEGIEVRYAPFDWVNEKAKLVVIGAMPEKAQARQALQAARNGLAMGMSLPEVAEKAKYQASFCGQAREAIARIFDHVGIAEALRLTSSESLFSEASELVHWTSALRYPIRRDGAAVEVTPKLVKQPAFANLVETWLGEELELVPRAQIIALGAVAEAAINLLVSEGGLDDQRFMGRLDSPSWRCKARNGYILGSNSDCRIVRGAAEAEARCHHMRKTVESWARSGALEHAAS